MTVRIIEGDCRKTLLELEDESVHCCVTSPPYWGLRDYGADEQIGLEEKFKDYIEIIVDVFRGVHRVLRKDGTLWLNMGDGYIGGRSGGIGSSELLGSQRNHRAARAAWEAVGGRATKSVRGLKAKDLIGMPWRLAFALQENGWWLRADIVWHKPSPMPESVRDRPTRAHEYIFLLSKSKRYHYDAAAIKEPVTGNAHPRGDLVEHRNKRSVWTVAQEPFADSHFATFPTELIKPCILAGCPDCGTVLDPFGGAGTTGLVADRLGRNAILLEANPKYCAMARERIRNDSPLFVEVS